MEDKNDKIVRQNNLLTTARYRMSALEKDIIYMMLSQLKADDTWERQYEIPIRMFQEKKGVRIRREELLSAAKKLISRGLTIYYEDQKKFITIGILVSADYGEEEKKNHLILGFDPKLYPFLTNLKQRFTTYRLQAALTLKSKHSKRLYEMFSQFKDTGVMKVSLKELKTRL
jgi:plasmid replication initiation protein